MKKIILISFVTLLIVSCGQKNKGPVNHSTTFGSVKITRESTTKIVIDVKIDNSESFCMSSGSYVQDFFSIEPENKNYQYDFDISSLGLLILARNDGGYNLLQDFPSEFKANFEIKEDEKKFILKICDDTFKFEI
jgi:hypothetical protein